MPGPYGDLELVVPVPVQACFALHCLQVSLQLIALCKHSHCQGCLPCQVVSARGAAHRGHSACSLDSVCGKPYLKLHVLHIPRKEHVVYLHSMHTSCCILSWRLLL